MAWITLAEAKVHLKLTLDTSDAMLNHIIPKATKYIDSLVRTGIASKGYKQLYNGNGQRSLMLDNSPIIAVAKLATSVNHTDQTYDSLLTENQDYIIDKGPGMIELLNQSFTEMQRNVYVEYTAGYVDAPEDLKLIALDLTAKKYYDLQDKRFGITQKNIRGDNVTFDYQDITDESMRIIKMYRRPPYSEGVDAVFAAGA